MCPSPSSSSYSSLPPSRCRPRLRLQVQALNLLAALEGPEDGGGGGGAEEAGEAPAATANTLDPDIRSAVYEAAAASGDWEVYNQLQQMYKGSADAEERQRTLLALGYAPGKSRVLATLAFALSGDVRAQVGMWWWGGGGGGVPPPGAPSPGGGAKAACMRVCVVRVGFSC